MEPGGSLFIMGMRWVALDTKAKPLNAVRKRSQIMGKQLTQAFHYCECVLKEHVDTDGGSVCVELRVSDPVLPLYPCLYGFS